MTIISQAQTIDTVAGLIGSLKRGENPIEFTKDMHGELIILVAGGVKLADFQFAIDTWNASIKPRGNWPYIRTIALVRRGQAIARSLED